MRRRGYAQRWPWQLTRKQKEVLRFIVECIDERGSPPTVREICDRFGLRSPASAQRYIQALERKGYLHRRPGSARAVELVWDRVNRVFWERAGIPLVGRVAAGEPILAEENIDDVLPLKGLFPMDQGLFALRVQGDSMVEAGIWDGDVVIVRPQPWANTGDVVVAVLMDAEEEGTVKRLGRWDEREVVLEPANPRYEPLRVKPEEVRIVGVVVGVLRKLNPSPPAMRPPRAPHPHPELYGEHDEYEYN